MSSIELKKKVYEGLETAEDYLLEEILSLIELESKKDEIIKIPNHFKNALEISIGQIQSGNTIPNADVEKEIEAWLYK
ncbi:MAG: hypothetical protein IPM42_16630 [Saprospiraceae bacterium]|nr:hypothetical protein [Saprospiraceae bacterium]